MERMIIRRYLPALLCGVFLAAVWGCQTGQEERGGVPGNSVEQAETPSELAGSSDDRFATGLPDDADPLSNLSSVAEKQVGDTVLVQGELFQQCPAIGCWFQIKDETGELFVDLNATDIRLTKSRVGHQVKVVGRLIQRGGQLQLEAERIEFKLDP